MIDFVRTEQRFSQQRSVPANVAAAYRAALRACRTDLPAGADKRLMYAGRMVIRALDQAAVAGELPYHNRHHAAEATLAMGWLCEVARRRGKITALEATVGVTAMLGHDLGHDGTAAQDGRLERLAAEAVDRIAGLARVQPRQRQQLAEIIRATLPSQVQHNAARALGPRLSGRFGRGVAMLRLLANEADIFASLMPRLGWTLGRALSDEGVRTGVGDARAKARHVGRLAFLRGMPRFSPAGRLLGLAAARDREVVGYTRIGLHLGFGPDPAAAAAHLDRRALQPSGRSLHLS